MKKDLLFYINQRIDYFSGEEDYKSMSESATDKLIVEELKAIKEFIIEKENN